MARTIWAATAMGCLLMGVGCLLDPGGLETGPRDLWLSDDAWEEVGPPPRDLPPETPGDPAPEEDTDLPEETGPADVAPPDSGFSDPGDEAGADLPPSDVVTCEEPSPAVFPRFEVSGFSTEESPMPPWGQGMIFGAATLTVVEGEDAAWRYRFRMDDGRMVTVETDLPIDQGPPFEAGDPVLLFAFQQVPWWRNLVFMLWDGNRTPRFFFHSASSLNQEVPWYPLPEAPSVWWPIARGLPDPCPPVDGGCGMQQVPPVELLAFGGVSSSESPVAFRRGEGGRNPTNPSILYRVLEAYAVVPDIPVCADYPSEWLEALIRVDGPSCDEEKIGFPRDNPERFEFYEVCLPKGDREAEAQAKALDPSLSCGVSGVFAHCREIGATGCHGELEKDPESGRLSWSSWFRLCLLSSQPFVLRMAGGHYL